MSVHTMKKRETKNVRDTCGALTDSKLTTARAAVEQCAKHFTSSPERRERELKRESMPCARRRTTQVHQT